MSSSLPLFLAVLFVAWLVQGVLSFRQARRFYGRIRHLRSLGRTAVGLSGSTYRGKAYGVLAVDDQDRIVHAEKLTGFTIFAQLRPVDQLVGRTLSDLLSGPVDGLSSKVYNAFKMAAETLANDNQPESAVEGEEGESADQPSELAVDGAAHG
jgi:DNA-binding transcriptional regulator of glucitol operon